MITWITQKLDLLGEKLKPILCYDNWFSDFWYDKIYGYMDCICCVFWRGVFIGTIFGFIIGMIL